MMIARLLFSFFVIGISPLASSESLPNEITIGLFPSGNVEEVKKGALTMAQALQDELNVVVNIFISKNYMGLVEAMKAKKIDFAFMPSMLFVFAEKNAGAKVLLKQIWSEPFYYSLLLTKASSKVHSVKDLVGKRIAFVDEKSASGYLYPQVMLKKSKIDLKKFKSVKYSGSHQASVDLLASDAADVIAVFGDDQKGKVSAWTKYSKSNAPNGNTKDQVRIIWVSEPIPNDPFCVRQDFYDKFPKLTHNLMFSLIDIVSNQKIKSSFSGFISANGFMPATTRQYDPVREMVKELDINLNSNFK